MVLSKSLSISGIYLICKIKGLVRVNISQSNKSMDCKPSKISTRDHGRKKKKEGDQVEEPSGQEKGGVEGDVREFRPRKMGLILGKHWTKISKTLILLYFPLGVFHRPNLPHLKGIVLFP